MKRLSAIVALALLATAILAPAAVAKEGDVITSGSCRGASTWKLKASPEDAGMEIKLEVDQNVVGDRWKIKLFHNGELIFKGKRTTLAPSGSWKVKRIVTEAAGRDVVRAKAVNLTTGEACFGRITF